ncbi:LPS export ABC transporter periplasmic protein LptC [Paraphotobacterium marinum]|uniref:LPS export ABC transporter periplasmic protein LptC n=1 Tax=Paraphotobacterium marinum TaxID=1755811 RepID=A0A220VC92_9GAMM|nr:LPS export ABC transporter periplasmic protein LptC [Paraphotobacterium marinum]ASK77949.1 LPS export ABC transporter periplasmic protein LptC [Paraphotobacterium marinum]
MIKKFCLYFFYLVIFIFLGYWAIQISLINESIKKEYSSKASASNIVLNEYTKNGKLSKTLVADHVTYNGENKKSFYYDPKLSVWNLNSKELQKEWYMSSDVGILDNDGLLLLRKNVVLLGYDSQLKKITTNSLQYNTKNSNFYSSDFVKIYGQNFINSGTGVKGNFNNKTATILEDAKGTYEQNIN